jgi:DNA repair protein RecN (Recombination protein N)
LEGLRRQIERTEKELEELEKEMFAQAKTLHETRKNAVPHVEKELQESLNALKLENTRLEFRLNALEKPNANGITELEIYFAPNLGIPPVPVHEAASGGELSRVMLALQSLMCTRTRLKSILFDEIDTGVSGDVAQKMGSMLKSMGESMQVIAITHLPQVAAKGGQHLLVSKGQSGDGTITSVRELNSQEHIEETARLMSGDSISASALETAKALMK